MTGRTLRSSRTLANSVAGQLDLDRTAVAIRLGEAAAKPPLGKAPYPGASFGAVVAAANPQKRTPGRVKRRPDVA